MALQLITGSANCGQSRVARSRAIDTVMRGGRATFLLPSAPDVSRALGEMGTSAPLGLSVASFNEYLDALWVSRGDGRAIVTPVQRLAVLAESGRHWNPESLQSSVGTPGMTGYLATIVSRAAESARPAGAPGERRGVGHDLLRLVGIYEKRLAAAGLVEQGAAHRMVVDGLVASDLPEAVVVDGFTSLSRAQEAFVLLAARFTDVVVALTYDPTVPATAAADALVARLAAGASLTRAEESEAQVKSIELQHIERHLGGVGAAGAVPSGAVVLSEAWGEASEAARIAREVQEAMADGMPPGEIAVVFRDVADHMVHVRSAFEEAGIDAEFDARVPFGATGLGRALLGIIAVWRADGAAETLLDVLRSRYSPADDGMLDRIDAQLRRTSRPTRDAIVGWCERGNPETSRFLSQSRRAMLSSSGPKAERLWYAIVSEMMRRAHGDAPNGDPDLLADAGAARSFMEAVSSLAEMGGAFAGPEVLSAALRETRVAIGAAGRNDRVQVLGAERARGRRYQCVILGGLTSGEFPRGEREDSLQAPAVKRVLERAGIDLEPRTTVADERLLFYRIVTRASQRLVLSRRSHDADGNALRPSIFLDELLDLYRDPDTGTSPAGEPERHSCGLEASASGQHVVVSRRRALRTLASGSGTADESEPRLEEAVRRAHTRRETVSAAVRRTTAERGAFSASEIEAYLQCPMRWCVERQVRPRELDEGIDAAAAGRIAHRIMNRFYDEYRARTGEDRVLPDTLDAARVIHEDVASEAVANAGPRSAQEAASLRTAVRKTARIVEADATFLPRMRPLALEWSFGMGPEDPPEEFDGFSLMGRVDRIDGDGERLIVSDYKSGTITAKQAWRAFDEQGLVQLPLYAAVAGRRLGLKVAGGVYRPLAGTKPRGFVHSDLTDSSFVSNDVVDDDDISLLIDDAVSRAAAAVGRMREGDVAPDPRGGKCPPFCPACGFCADWRPSHARS